MSNNLTDNFVYELPNGTVQVEDALFNLPMQYTGGHFINVWLFGLAGILFIGGLQFEQGARRSALFSGFGTFMVTFLLTLAGFAGGNQLIPATVVLIGAILLNYMTSGRGGARL